MKSYLGLPQFCFCQPGGTPRVPTSIFDQSSTITAFDAAMAAMAKTTSIATGTTPRITPTVMCEERLDRDPPQATGRRWRDTGVSAAAASRHGDPHRFPRRLGFQSVITRPLRVNARAACECYG